MVACQSTTNNIFSRANLVDGVNSFIAGKTDHSSVLLDFSLTVKAAPHECVIRTSQP